MTRPAARKGLRTRIPPACSSAGAPSPPCSEYGKLRPRSEGREEDLALAAAGAVLFPKVSPALNRSTAPSGAIGTAVLPRSRPAREHHRRSPVDDRAPRSVAENGGTPERRDPGHRASGRPPGEAKCASRERASADDRLIGTVETAWQSGTVARRLLRTARSSALSALLHAGR